MHFNGKVTSTIASTGDHAMLMGRRIKNVYLAGKVARSPWRDEIVSYEDGRWSGMNHGILYDAVGLGGEWKIVPGVLPTHAGQSLAMTGPYWFPLHEDPSCGCCGGHCVAGSCSGGLHLCGVMPQYGQSTVESDTRRIKANIDRSVDASDLVFAWIDGLDTFGTLYEIGRASALDKLIVAAIPPSFAWRELWVSLASAHRLIFAMSPGDAWRQLWSPPGNPLGAIIKESRPAAPENED